MKWGDDAYEWVGDWSGRRAILSPDRTAIVDETTGDEYSYTDVDRRANRAGRLLDAAGVVDGNRVAYVGRNRIEAFDLFCGTGKTGGVLAPLSYRLAPPELAALLDLIDPELLVIESPFVERLEHGIARAAVDPPVLEIETDEPAGGWDVYREHLPEADDAIDVRRRALADPHLLLHTGGSTGTPKETTITHGSIYWNAFNTITAWGLRPDDVTPMVFPLFHTGGWNVLTLPIFSVGGTIVIDREVDPGRILDQVESHRATILVSVPAVLRAMARHDDWESTDLSSLRFVKSGGGPCRESIVRAWRDRGVDLTQGYGLTEVGPNNFAMPDEFDPAKVASVGKPVLHTDVRVVDDDGEPLGTDEIGELELSGPHAAAGYWHNAEATEGTFGDGSATNAIRSRLDCDGTMADGDGLAGHSDEPAGHYDEPAGHSDEPAGHYDEPAGHSDEPAGHSDRHSSDGVLETDEGYRKSSWVSTGDLASRDADGFYHIEGRKKNMFVSGGENVYPPEVEDVIADHPAVSEVIVIGVPDDRWGTVGKAVVEPTDATLAAVDEEEPPLTIEELAAFMDERLARFKIPDSLAFVDEMPTSGPSKLDREAIEDRFGESTDEEGR